MPERLLRCEKMIVLEKNWPFIKNWVSPIEVWIGVLGGDEDDSQGGGVVFSLPSGTLDNQFSGNRHFI